MNKATLDELEEKIKRIMYATFSGNIENDRIFKLIQKLRDDEKCAHIWGTKRRSVISPAFPICSKCGYENE